MTLMFQISFLGIILNETMIFITFVCCTVDQSRLTSSSVKVSFVRLTSAVCFRTNVIIYWYRNARLSHELQCHKNVVDPLNHAGVHIFSILRHISIKD